MTATITVTGGLTSPPEIRFTQSGTTIASGTIASTDRYLDKKTDEWKDGKKLYLRWSAFREVADNIATSNLDKGEQVTVTGKLHTREWEDSDGKKRSSTELEVTDFAVSLRRATATVARTTGSSGSHGRSGGGGGSSQGSYGAQNGGDAWAPNAPAGDVWSTPGSYNDETPF